MIDDDLRQQRLTPPNGGRARLERALDADARRERATPRRALALTAAAALAVVAVVAVRTIENQPERVFARRVEAALDPSRISGAMQERGIERELRSRRADVRIVVAETLPNAKLLNETASDAAPN